MKPHKPVLPVLCIAGRKPPKEKELYKMVTTEELDLTFQKVGNDFGFEAKAEFAPFRDLKIKWFRSYKWAEFTVSDYLKDAPENVIEGIARTIFSKIKGTDESYSDEVIEWLTSDEFVDSMQPTYISRDRRIGSPIGEHKNLQEALDRLKEKGLIKTDLNRTKLFWSIKTKEEKPAWSSTLMRTVTVNKSLDSDDVPEEVLDYVLLNQIAFIECDFGMDPMDRQKTIEERVQKYPGFDGITEWLNDRGLRA